MPGDRRRRQHAPSARVERGQRVAERLVARQAPRPSGRAVSRRPLSPRAFSRGVAARRARGQVLGRRQQKRRRAGRADRWRRARGWWPSRAPGRRSESPTPRRTTGAPSPAGQVSRSSPTARQAWLGASPARSTRRASCAGGSVVQAGGRHGQHRPGAPRGPPRPARRRATAIPRDRQVSQGIRPEPARYFDGRRTGRGRTVPRPGTSRAVSGSKVSRTNRANVTSSNPVSGPAQQGRAGPEPDQDAGQAGPASRTRAPRRRGVSSPRAPRGGAGGRPGRRPPAAVDPHQAPRMASAESGAGRPGRAPFQAPARARPCIPGGRHPKSMSRRSGPIVSSPAWPSSARRPVVASPSGRTTVVAPQ